MYFPYVFGRRSELLALREANEEYIAPGRVLPVIEPVLKRPNDLLRCMKVLGEAESTAVIIVNPHQGDFKNGGVTTAWLKEVDIVFAACPTLLPGLRCGPNEDISFVQNFLKKYPESKTGLLYSGSILGNSDVTSLAKRKEIAYHICLQNKMADTQRKLLPKTKAVDILDNFNKQVRNADYSGKEFFTDHPSTYQSTAIGFGDYTITGNLFQPGGGKPAAVAIHAIFKNAKLGDVWIEHFVSDDTDIAVGSAASKYLEAVAKVAKAGRNRKAEFGVNRALKEFDADDRNQYFPGLGKSKERQIYHHIAAMHDVLAGAI